LYRSPQAQYFDSCSSTHAVVRVPGELQHLLEVVGIAPRRLRGAGFDAHELDRLHRLRLAVLEDFEVRRLQALDDLAVALRVHIDGDEDGLAAEHGRPLLLRRRLLLGGGDERAGQNRERCDCQGKDGDGRSSRSASAHGRMPFRS
jgi:hypothetical protein